MFILLVFSVLKTKLRDKQLEISHIANTWEIKQNIKETQNQL